MGVEYPRSLNGNAESVIGKIGNLRQQVEQFLRNAIEKYSSSEAQTGNTPVNAILLIGGFSYSFVLFEKRIHILRSFELTFFKSLRISRSSLSNLLIFIT